MAIPVIDVFAGPGGLSEGFSSVEENGKTKFEVKLSIEMDANAHKTLELRSFYRKFPKESVPSEYYNLLRTNSLKEREELREKLFERYPKQAAEAQQDAWCAELGGENFPPELVDERIAKALNGAKDWVLIGGPPCQAYSVVGRARKQQKDELDNEDGRVHLYKEYLRIIAQHHPTVFVMENVRGLLSSKLGGKKMFDLIKGDLQNPTVLYPESNSPKYRVFSLVKEPIEFEDGQPIYSDDSDYLIKAEEFRVPQARHRVILLGVREDVTKVPSTLKAEEEKVSLKDVIGDLPKVRSGLGRTFEYVQGDDGQRKRAYRNVEDTDPNWVDTIREFRNEITSWKGFESVDAQREVHVPVHGIGGEFIQCSTPSMSNPLNDWYRDEKLKGAANHISRAHMIDDLKRYLFAGLYTKVYGRFPRLSDYESHDDTLLPDHKSATSGKFADRFRVQRAEIPATTVTSHISKDGHYFIHYDAEQCRSLTVREAARIQTFPDNYLFCGTRTAQYHQVGNAVPPYLANQIAKVVAKMF